MDFERGAVILDGSLGIPGHVICASAPDQALFQHRFADGIFQCGGRQIDYIREAVAVVVGKIGPGLYHIMR